MRPLEYEKFIALSLPEFLAETNITDLVRNKYKEENPQKDFIADELLQRAAEILYRQLQVSIPTSNQLLNDLKMKSAQGSGQNNGNNLRSILKKSKSMERPTTSAIVPTPFQTDISRLTTREFARRTNLVQLIKKMPNIASTDVRPIFDELVKLSRDATKFGEWSGNCLKDLRWIDGTVSLGDEDKGNSIYFNIKFNYIWKYLEYLLNFKFNFYAFQNNWDIFFFG